MDPSLRWIYWLIIVLLVLLSGFFNGAETALASCNQFRFRVRANDDEKAAKVVSYILDRYDQMSISIVVENNIVNTVAATMGAILFRAAYFPHTNGFADLMSTIVITIIIYIFSDTFPKIIARAIPDEFIKISSYFLIFFFYVLYPINIVFHLFAKLVKKIFRVRDSVTLTEEDFSNFIDESEETGRLDKDESEIIQNALDFMDTSIREVYTPASKIYMIDYKGLTVEKLNRLLIISNYSRIPIYYENRDNVIGILNVKTYFNAYLENKNLNIKSILSNPYFVEPNVNLDYVFSVFRKNKVHLALIRSNNKIIGMVTMEDILEELIGEMAEISSTKGESKNI